MNGRLAAALSGAAATIAICLWSAGVAGAANAGVAGANASVTGAADFGASRHASATFAHGVSANWSGYVATRTTVSDKYRRVAGSWTQPRGRCASGTSTYSAIWVGLGGFANGVQALEQTGSEVDCTGKGRALYSAWFELVPASPVELPLRIHPGDRLNASVAVDGATVIMQVRDLTTGKGRTVLRRMRNPGPDLTSAEWIVEAPSACTAIDVCRTLPLTNFGSVAFSNASATTEQGARTPIVNDGYEVTVLQLRDSAPARQAGRGREAAVLAGADPSELLAGASTFTVSWQRLSSGQAGEATGPAYSEVRPNVQASVWGVKERVRGLHPRAPA
ncbi:MAG: G1 family glutamic endopeptidase [Solirubrobacteraceae bacterium]